jgi:hypothetical protein
MVNTSPIAASATNSPRQDVRAEEQLPDGEAGDARSERELDLGSAGVEVAGQLRQPGQVEVDRQRAEGGQRAEDQHASNPARPGREDSREHVLRFYRLLLERKLRRRNEFETTNTLENAIALPAISGFR